jgi:hypothetical protein
MSHGDTIAIDEPDGITCLNLLAINGGEVLVLIVTEHSFLRAIG